MVRIHSFMYMNSEELLFTFYHNEKKGENHLIFQTESVNT